MVKCTVALVLCALAFVSYASAQGAIDCEGSYTSAECEEYSKTSGGRIVLNSFTDPDQFNDIQKAKLKVVIANVSDDYVLSDVEPRHIFVTAVDVSAESDNKVTVHFFVSNPTGSVVMPTAFRSQELYLMMKLNRDKMEEMLDYEVSALQPDSGNDLPIPTWALAIIVYAGLVIIIALMYVGTSDIRRQWSEVREEKLRKAVQGDSDMEIDPESGAVESSTKPAKMYRDNQTSFGVQVTKEDIATTLGITYATMDWENSNSTKKADPNAPPQDTSEYMEIKGPEDVATSAAADDGAAATGADGDKHELEATAALEGAVNEAYEEDKTTSL